MGNPHAITSDQNLLDAVRSGDRSAFETIVRKYQNLVTSVAYSGTGDLAQSEDLAQQAFLIAWQKQGEIGDGNRLAGWLCGVVKNLARNSRRKTGNIQRTQGANLDDVSEPVSHSVAPDRIVIEKERQTMLWSVLERLPENYREPLILFYRENQSIESVAQSLGISQDAVKQRLSRGRSMVRDELQQFVEDTLVQSQPSPAFAMAVMAALPAVSTAAGATAGKGAAGLISTITIKKLFGGWIMTGAVLGSLGGIVGALGGLAGAWYGVRASLKNATSEEEKRLTIQFGKMAVGVGIAFAAMILAITMFDWKGHIWIPIVVLSCVDAAVIVALIINYNRKLFKIKREHGTDEERLGNMESKPVSQFNLRLNSICASSSIWIWLLIMFAISQAWIMMAASCVYLVAQTIYISATSRNFTTVLGQARFMTGGMVASSIALGIVILVGWPYIFFADQCPSYLRYLLPFGFCLLAFLICGGILAAVEQRYRTSQ